MSKIKENNYKYLSYYKIKISNQINKIKWLTAKQRRLKIKSYFVKFRKLSETVYIVLMYVGTVIIKTNYGGTARCSKLYNI